MQKEYLHTSFKPSWWQLHLIRWVVYRRPKWFSITSARILSSSKKIKVRLTKVLCNIFPVYCNSVSLHILTIVPVTVLCENIYHIVTRVCTLSNRRPSHACFPRISRTLHLHSDCYKNFIGTRSTYYVRATLNNFEVFIDA